MEKGEIQELPTFSGDPDGQAVAINDSGQAVGGSGNCANSTFHAFLWTTDNGIQDLGTLPGDLNSFGFGMNSEDQVVGTSFDASGTPRAFLRQGGVMTDLNTLIPAGSSLFLFDAFAIEPRESRPAAGGARATPCR